VTYAEKIRKEEAAIDWTQPALHIARRVRALNPTPGATTTIHGQRLKLWRARPIAAAGEAGTVLTTDTGGIVVACGSGALAIEELQREGGKRLAAQTFLRGFKLSIGTRLGA